MVRIGPMASPKDFLDRRGVVAGLGAVALCPALPVSAWAQGRIPVALQARPDRLALRTGGPETAVWSLAGQILRFKRGEALDVTFDNQLPAPVALAFRGLDGAPSAEPLIARPAIPGGARDSFQLPLRHSGTFLADAIPLGETGGQPVRPRAIVVTDPSPIALDRDEVMLIEEWRLRDDGSAIPAGQDTKGSTPIHTLNGQTSFDLSAPSNARLRLRFINGSPRSVLAVKLDGVEVRVIALDGLPAEPFAARNGALVLAPGGRTDVLIDMVGPAGTSVPILLHDGKQARNVGKLTIASGAPARAAILPPAAPLPANDLPEKIDLKSAARFGLALGTAADWTPAAALKASSASAFQVTAGRTVVLAVTNRAEIATVFHLHGHHFRLLDRLDDGWKPFRLDTLAIEPGQTQRLAFLAEYPGRYLIEQVATDWAAPRLLRWYGVQ